MKKIYNLFVVFSVSMILALSCQKESPVSQDKPVDNLSDCIPEAITCEISPEDVTTKTQYAGNRTFGWTSGDAVAMVIMETPTSPNTSKWGISPYTTAAENGSPSATFINGSKNLDTYTDLYPVSTTNFAGYVIYPQSIYNYTSWQTSGTVDDNNGHPVVTLPTSYTYNASNPIDSETGVIIPMIGRKIANSKFQFSTAVGILKVTIEDFPWSATKVQLISSANNLAGKFAVSDVSDNVAQIANTPYNNGGTGTLTLNVSGLTDHETYDFYFPVPVGVYAENVLTIKVLDSSNDRLIQRSINKSVTVARNEVLALPSMSHPNTVTLDETKNASEPRCDWYFTCDGIRYAISNSENTNPADFHSGDKYTYSASSHNNHISLVNVRNPGAETKYLPTHGSGHYYLHWIFVKNTSTEITSLNDDVVIDYGHLDFYYITEDEANLAGTYNANQSDVDWTGSGTHDNLVKIEVPKVTEGSSLKLTYFRQRSYDMSDDSGKYATSAVGGVPVYGNVSTDGETKTLTFRAKDNFDDKLFFFKSGAEYYIVGGGSSKGSGGDYMATVADFSFVVGENGSGKKTLTNTGFIDVIYSTSASNTGYKYFWSFQNLTLTHQ